MHALVISVINYRWFHTLLPDLGIRARGPRFRTPRVPAPLIASDEVGRGDAHTREAQQISGRLNRFTALSCGAVAGRGGSWVSPVPTAVRCDGFNGIASSFGHLGW